MPDGLRSKDDLFLIIGGKAKDLGTEDDMGARWLGA